MTPDDLVERVARAMAVGEGFDPDLIINNDTPDCPQPLWRLYRRSARAAIAVLRPALRADALEEAAKVCDEAEKRERQAAKEPCDAEELAAFQRGAFMSRINAAAIRALAKQSTTEEGRA